MLIDCDSCAVRGAACSGCMVSALIDAPSRTNHRDGPGHRHQLAGPEQRAIDALLGAGFEVEVLAQTISAPPRAARRARRRRNVA
jgi:hypothetical protein